MIAAFIITLCTGAGAFALGRYMDRKGRTAKVPAARDDSFPYAWHEAPEISASPCRVCGMPSPHGFPHRKHHTAGWVKREGMYRDGDSLDVWVADRERLPC